MAAVAQDATAPRYSAAQMAGWGGDTLPGLLGIEVTAVGPDTLRAELPLRRALLAPNGYLHAGSIVTLADTACGYACVAHMPEGAKNFTTVELKSNFLGTVREGRIVADVRAAHLGRTTQVWDATVSDTATGKVLALFRCTQMILYPK